MRIEEIRFPLPLIKELVSKVISLHEQRHTTRLDIKETVPQKPEEKESLIGKVGGLRMTRRLRRGQPPGDILRRGLFPILPQECAEISDRADVPSLSSWLSLWNQNVSELTEHMGSDMTSVDLKLKNSSSVLDLIRTWRLFLSSGWAEGRILKTRAEFSANSASRSSASFKFDLEE